MYTCTSVYVYLCVNECGCVGVYGYACISRTGMHTNVHIHVHMHMHIMHYTHHLHVNMLKLQCIEFHLRLLRVERESLNCGSRTPKHQHMKKSVSMQNDIMFDYAAWGNPVTPRYHTSILDYSGCSQPFSLTYASISSSVMGQFT